MLSLKQLTYALAIDKTRHFKRAAELCSVSQSALSTAISELEKQLGVQIFERDNKKVLVTAVGEQILEKARNIKFEIDSLYLLT
ncbi:MAG: LysR family transcriptional regulator, partial [Sneathiella sp.]|nr:LysR family transcriptional regulator [Sneathiella sp.]